MVSYLKSPRWASRAVLDLARDEECLLRSPLCNHRTDTTVACHGAGVANGKGMGYKVGDEYTVFGCCDCNHFTDAYNGATAEEKAEVFAAGHARQIKRWIEIADGHGKPAKKKAALAALVQLGLR